MTLEPIKYLSGVLFCLIIIIQFTFAQSEPKLFFQDDSGSGNGKLILSGLETADFEALKELKPEVLQFQEFFPIYIGNNLPDKEESLLPVSGKYTLENNAIRFTPRFPFLVNKKYYTCFYPKKFKTLIYQRKFDKEEKLVDLVFLPQINPDNLFPEVTNVYPSIAEIPQNQLRFYIHFSKKMLTGHSLEHIKLYNQNGELEENAFLNLDPELWDPSGKRLTIWFDPGRIKRDLSPNLEYGVPLEIGGKYTLEISSNFKDTQGNPLSKIFKKTFVVTAPDRSSPKPENWEITYPQPNSKASLSIIFNEPMDQAITSRMIEVLNENGKFVNGKVVMGEDEKSWIFTPSENWVSGKYQISINTKLEDLAGNSLKRLFDADSQNIEPSPYLKKDYLILKFEISVSSNLN